MFNISILNKKLDSLTIAEFFSNLKSYNLEFKQLDIKAELEDSSYTRAFVDINYLKKNQLQVIINIYNIHIFDPLLILYKNSLSDSFSKTKQFQLLINNLLKSYIYYKYILVNNYLDDWRNNQINFLSLSRLGINIYNNIQIDRLTSVDLKYYSKKYRYPLKRLNKAYLDQTHLPGNGKINQYGISLEGFFSQKKVSPCLSDHFYLKPLNKQVSIIDQTHLESKNAT